MEPWIPSGYGDCSFAPVYPEARNRLTPLAEAAADGEVEVVRRLADEKADLDSKDADGMTPMGQCRCFAGSGGATCNETVAIDYSQSSSTTILQNPKFVGLLVLALLEFPVLAKENGEVPDARRGCRRVGAYARAGPRGCGPGRGLARLHNAPKGVLLVVNSYFACISVARVYAFVVYVSRLPPRRAL